MVSKHAQHFSPFSISLCLVIVPTTIIKVYIKMLFGIYNKRAGAEIIWTMFSAKLDLEFFYFFLSRYFRANIVT